MSFRLRPRWPRRISSRILLVLLAAFLAAQGLGFWIFSDERRFALESQRREQLVGHVVSTVELLAALPPEQHRRLIRHTSGPGLRVWLATGSSLPPEEDDARNRLERLLAARLGALATEVRARRVGGGGEPWRPWHGEDDDTPERLRGPPPLLDPPEPERRPPENGRRHDERPERLPPEGLVIAIHLAGGAWLNALAPPPPSPPAPAWRALATLSVLGLVVLLAVLLLVGRITRPLRALALAADQLGRGAVVPPLAESGPEEIRRTTRAFNRMQARIRRFVDDRTRMLAAISHDLRTPITTLRLRAELLDDDEQRVKFQETLEEMERITLASLAFAREESSSEESRPVDLAALVESLALDLQDQGKDVQVAPTERTVLVCRPSAIRRALTNLIVNACAYGERARVALARSADEIRITVEDDGPGIAAADRERVFEPFVRLEPSRNAATGGIGLGLAIARTIARAHGGDILLADRDQGGLVATLVLPADAGEPLAP